MNDEPNRETFERGRKEGLDDATLAAHSKHLDKINGSLEALVKAEERMRQMIRDLGDDVRKRFDKTDATIRETIAAITDEVRTMQEEKRRDTTKVEGARAALAEQTETRRTALAETAAQGLTQRQKLSLAVAVLALVLTAIGLYLGIH